MGINLSEIVTSEPRSLEDFSGKVLAIDAFNTLYQFLAIIRQPDGTPLMDHQGRVTSHLSGLIYRLSNFVAAGIKPVFVFDGEPPRLKARTLVARGEIKQRAVREWREAVEIGDLATARTKAMQTSRLTNEMVDQSKHLLDLLGIPVVQAPAEGEAQASVMAAKGIAYAAASQDFDALLFGSPRLVKNLAISGRRKLPRKDVFVDVQPEEISLAATLAALGITREQLVDMALLIGTDFNEGVKGIGPKKALALIKKFGSLESALAELGVDIESKDEVREIFLHPNVIEVVELKFHDPDKDGVRHMLCDEHDFSRERIDAALEKFGTARSEQKQKSLDGWFGPT
jgi:flap endonuclease-1